MEKKETTLTKQQIKEALWRRGSLSWLLDNTQKALYEMFHNNPAKTQTWLLSRRSGKSFSLCVLSIEYCLKHPNSVIKYVAPAKNQVERFIRPIIDTDILPSCPDDIKPVYNSKREMYVFPNGSQLQLCGAEKQNIDSIRGGFAHIAIIDEAQDVSDLKYAITSVLLPTTLTTKGKVLISGTPPKNPDHEFISIIEKAEVNNTLIRRTIYDNPRLSAEDIQMMAEEMGGVDSEDFRRECLCQVIKSKNVSVIPEFTEEKIALLVHEHPKPVFYHPYVSIDFGFRDWTVVLFGYYDFMNDLVVIEDEIVTSGTDMFLGKLSTEIMEKERKLWIDPIEGTKIEPKKRVGDHNLVAMNEIKKASNYQLHFVPADKHQKMAGINALRTLVNGNKVIIDPKCKTLVSHLFNAKWAKQEEKDTFARCPQGSHYDAVDALVYLIKSIDAKDNPYPKNYNSPLNASNAHFTLQYNQSKLDTKKENIYKKIFGVKSKDETKQSNPYSALLKRK